MPALTDLPARLRADRDWRDSYKEQRRNVKTAINRIFLVHVSGHNKRKPFIDLLLNPPYEIPTSDPLNNYCSYKTRRAEAVLGLDYCVYFYAGRAHKDFGEIALAFELDSEDGHTGFATPFDTGGLAVGKIKTSLPDKKMGTRRAFTQASQVPLGKEWRKALRRFISAYFRPHSEYWQDNSFTPFRVDPEELFRNSDWRSRVFEVRFHEGQAILAASFWCAQRGQTEILDREAVRLRRIGVTNSPLYKFLKIRRLAPNGTQDYCELVDQEILRGVM